MKTQTSMGPRPWIPNIYTDYYRENVKNDRKIIVI
jgi:hypothetical protein